MLRNVAAILGLLAVLPSCGQRTDREADLYGTPFAVHGALKLAAVAPNVNLGLRSYSDCEELTADIQNSLEQQNSFQKANLALAIQQASNWARRPPSQASEAMQDSAAGATETMTNVQEHGVDEADRYRVGLDQIFAVTFDRVQVVDRVSLGTLGTIPLSSGSNALLFTQEHKLILIENSSGASQVRIFRTQAGSMPELERTWSVPGSYIDSRLVGPHLIMVMNDRLPLENEPFEWQEFAEEQWFHDPIAKRAYEYSKTYYTRASLRPLDGAISGIPCAAISRRKVADFDLGFAKILSLNINAPESAEKGIGSIGQGSQIYVTADSVYLVKSNLQWFNFGGYASYNPYGGPDERVYIRQASFNKEDGTLTMEAEGEVAGRIKDRWALRGFNAGQNLVVATSTGLLWSTEVNIAQNHLFVLDKDVASKSLQIKSAIMNFGTHEDIRAVRYIGDKAYIVTFKKTDPLFAFDLADLADPKLLSGLKIPGFSTYLHPLADGRMFGLGFDAAEQGSFAYYQGVQVSLFDISNPLEMARIDNHIYGTRGSSSEATSNHHAFFHDAASGLIGLPIVQLGGDSLKGEQTSRVFSGAILLGFTGDKLIEKGRVSHAEWLPASCKQEYYGQWWQNQTASLDVNRIYRVDDRLITLSPLGLKAYALTDFGQPIHAQAFDAGPASCWGAAHKLRL
ncbi:beta-propeller domain-containing protein [Oligoflexus tunisiensis]|uniref:beta-propeller domain-containing protein n=1 Tax=Oligoflexus tunisiensis TaxID=708132 RepID=UPI00114CD85E|nr:beta-propeller domain-containing protein [Oligoflexus tunisiensis]